MTDVVNVRCHECGRWLLKVHPRSRRVVRLRGDKVGIEVPADAIDRRVPGSSTEIDLDRPLPAAVVLTCPRCGSVTRPFVADTVQRKRSGRVTGLP